MSDKYTDNMTRVEGEKQRLNEQFEIFTENIGYILHPSITSALPSTPRIADIGTGTGVLLLQLQKAYPNAVLDGFDISPAFFPPPEDLPSNVTLAVLDLKQPFPEEMHGKYDVVHLRLLVAAMLPEEWEPAVRNVLTLLKPGGFLQWDECDFRTCSHLRGNIDSRVESARLISDAFVHAFQDQFAYGWSTLPGHMKAAGLTVATDVVSSDRVPSTRERLSVITMGLMFRWARLMAERKAPGSMSDDELECLEKEAYDDIKSGCYLRYDIYIACGRKPLQTGK
ncbi:S-adenosyl-L-methionine-dependent methyltransferase [Hypomontagnella monticulosa]|nr:S-adenosyl-L-methionine-dependent methyltransferase [Hypomontagnella monticulosa]